MGQGNKSSVIILIVLILISLSLAGATFYLFQKERSKNVSLQRELDELNSREKIFKEKLKESNNIVSDLGTKLQLAQTQVDNLTGELDKERTAKEEKLAEIEQLKAAVEKEKISKSDLEKKLEQAQKDAENMQSQLKELEGKKTGLEAKIKDLEGQVKETKQQQAQKPQEQGVELGKIVVSPETSAEKKEMPEPKNPNVEGKVLVVNKDYNFAVINLGNKDGVEVGNIFSVYNGNKHIGVVKVDRVHDSMSAVSFVSQDMKDRVKEGDRVVLKTK